MPLNCIFFTQYVCLSLTYWTTVKCDQYYDIIICRSYMNYSITVNKFIGILQTSK